MTILSSIEGGPRNFIEKQYDPGEDLTEIFGRGVLPYIYNGFRLWRANVYKNGNREVRNEVAPRDLNFSKGIDLWARTFIKLTYNATSIDFTRSFPTSIEGCVIPQNKEEVNQGIRAWLGMMLRKITWDPDIPNAPYIIDLTGESPLTVSLLPKIVNLHGYRMIRLMDSFYAPDKKGANWSEKLFEHLGPEKYESMADLELKQAIDAMLLSEVSGNIFDIGCGSGLLQKWIKEWGTNSRIILFGIDVCQTMLDKAKERGERVILGNAATMSPDDIRREFEKAGFKINSFNHAVMSYVDNWLSPDEREAIFKTTWQLLTPGGSLRLNIYDTKPGWATYYRELLHQTGFDKDNIHCFQETLKARDGFREVGFVFAQK